MAMTRVQITVHTRDATASEAAQQRSKMNMLYGVDDELVDAGTRTGDGHAGDAATAPVQDDLFSDDDDDPAD